MQAHGSSCVSNSDYCNGESSYNYDVDIGKLLIISISKRKVKFQSMDDGKSFLYGLSLKNMLLNEKVERFDEIIGRPSDYVENKFHL